MQNKTVLKSNLDLTLDWKVMAEVRATESRQYAYDWKNRGLWSQPIQFGAE